MVRRLPLTTTRHGGGVRHKPGYPTADCNLHQTRQNWVMVGGWVCIMTNRPIGTLPVAVTNEGFVIKQRPRLRKLGIISTPNPSWDDLYEKLL